MSDKRKNRSVRVARREPQPVLGRTFVSEEVFQSVLANRLQQLRVAKGAVQETVAEVFCTDKAAVSRLELGVTKLTAYQALVAANAYGVDIAELLKMEVEASDDEQ